MQRLHICKEIPLQVSSSSNRPQLIGSQSVRLHHLAWLLALAAAAPALDAQKPAPSNNPP